MIKKSLLFAVAPLMGLLLLCSCSRSGREYTIELTHTGCKGDTKSSELPEGIPQTKGLFGEDRYGTLNLIHTDKGLAVVTENVELNCAFKLGLVCDVEISGNEIHYRIHQKDEDISANCICTVEQISSVVQGLTEGKDYILDYRCEYIHAIINFTYRKSLNKSFDLEKYMIDF